MDFRNQHHQLAGVTSMGDVTAIAILQCIQSLAIAASFASVLMINARVFGIALVRHAGGNVASLHQGAVVVTRGAGAVRFLMIIAGFAIRELINPYFWIKMALLVVAVVVAIRFARSLNRQAVAVDTASGGLKSTALVLVILWCMIMWCGRWIAYAFRSKGVLMYSEPENIWQQIEYSSLGTTIA